MIIAHSRNTVNPAIFPIHAQALRLWDGGTRMALINPSPGVYNWDKLDVHLAASEAAGLQSIYTFGSTPAWAAIPTTGQAGLVDATSNRPVDPAALATFVDALMAHCGNRLWAIEPWNEWNAPGFWIGSVAQLAVQQHIIYTHAKKANPNIIVTTPTPCWAPKCQYPSSEAALAAFLPMGMPFDVVTFHGYTDPTLKTGACVTATIQAIRNVMAAERSQGSALGHRVRTWPGFRFHYHGRPAPLAVRRLHGPPTGRHRLGLLVSVGQPDARRDGRPDRKPYDLGSGVDGLYSGRKVRLHLMAHDNSGFMEVL
jgi:hypothetical protein